MSYCGLVDAKIRASDIDSPVHTVKSKAKISQNFVAFSEDMNFTPLKILAKRISVAQMVRTKLIFNQKKTIIYFKGY